MRLVSLLICPAIKEATRKTGKEAGREGGRERKQADMQTSNLATDLTAAGPLLCGRRGRE